MAFAVGGGPESPTGLIGRGSRASCSSAESAPLTRHTESRQTTGRFIHRSLFCEDHQSLARHDTIEMSDVTRRTQAAQVARSLRALGRPATKRELAALCGLDAARVGSLLSKLEGVVRADRYRWGYAEWIDDEYDGIPAEIIQRIEEDGGSTRLSRLLDELPRLFGVSEMSVRSTLGSPVFRVEHGWVSVVENPSLDVGTLEDVATGRDINGDLYWAFRMYNRYLRGYSITGVPPEVAVSLGCNFGERTYISVQTPHGVPSISVIWRKTSTTGPEIGRVAQSLKAIRASDGDSIAIVVRPDRTVSVAHQHDVSEPAQAPIGTQMYRHATSSSNRGEENDELGTGVRVMKPIMGRLEIRLELDNQFDRNAVSHDSGSES